MIWESTVQLSIEIPLKSLVISLGSIRERASALPFFDPGRYDNVKNKAQCACQGLSLFAVLFDDTPGSCGP